MVLACFVPRTFRVFREKPRTNKKPIRRKYGGGVMVVVVGGRNIFARRDLITRKTIKSNLFGTKMSKKKPLFLT